MTPASRRRRQRLPVCKTDIAYFGPTKNCPGCRFTLGERASKKAHSQECQERIFAAQDKSRLQREATGVQRAFAAAEAFFKYNGRADGLRRFHVLHDDLKVAAASLLDEKLRVAVLDLVIEMRKRFTVSYASSYRGPAKQILEILSQGALEVSRPFFRDRAGGGSSSVRSFGSDRRFYSCDDGGPAAVLAVCPSCILLSGPQCVATSRPRQGMEGSRQRGGPSLFSTPSSRRWWSSCPRSFQGEVMSDGRHCPPRREQAKRRA